MTTRKTWIRRSVSVCSVYPGRFSVISDFPATIVPGRASGSPCTSTALIPDARASSAWACVSCQRPIGMKSVGARRYDRPSTVPTTVSLVPPGSVTRVSPMATPSLASVSSMTTPFSPVPTGSPSSGSGAAKLPDSTPIRETPNTLSVPYKLHVCRRCTKGRGVRDARLPANRLHRLRRQT
jgi:hypothetical protein